MSRAGLVAMALAALMLTTPALFAQRQIASGRALDGSLQLGSSGYNAATQVRGPMLNARPFEPYRGRFHTTSPILLDGPMTFRGQRNTTRDLFLQERSYRAGWQRQGVPGATRSVDFDPGARRLDGRIR